MLTSLVALSLLLHPGENPHVLDTVDAFFVALERADRAAFEDLVREGTVFHTVRRGEDGEVRHSTTDRDAWLDGLAGQEGKIVEVYWTPSVSVSPIGLAQVWAPYYVEYEGKPLHCGVDAFTLAHTPEGRWQIIGLADTRDPEGCERLGYESAQTLRPQSLVPKLSG
ncbi:MAG: hypothetical protein V2I43_14885 [Parvularcula sp.]|jgi:hypothetical protein|nr:hypothetical protein [Parvularcula sp.]